MNTEPLTIEQRSRRSSIEKLGRISPAYELGYEHGAQDQQKEDIENCVKWCENFNDDAEKTGVLQRIDVESFRQWITNMITPHENY